MLSAGAASVDITPHQPLILGGFGRTALCQGVAREIKVRALLLERAGTRALLVSADLVRWGPERVTALRARLAEAVGVAPDLVQLYATHTHCAPQTTSSLTPFKPPADPAYIDMLEARTLAAARAAEKELAPVTISLGYGDCAFSINRRLKRAGQIAMAPNPDGPVDPTVTVATLRRGDGRTPAFIVHFTCHPTTSAQNQVSPDYPGTAMDRLEALAGEGAVALFLQGCCGDIKPALTNNGRFYYGSQEDVGRLAEQLATVAIGASASARERLDEVPLTGRRQLGSLPYSRLPEEDELRRLAAQSDRDGRWASCLLAHPHWKAGHTHLEVSLLEIAEGLSLLGLSAEPVVEYGFAIRRLSGGTALPVGYSEGVFGYLPTAAQLAEGGYEAEDAIKPYGHPAPLAPAVERVTLEAVERVLLGENGSGQRVAGHMSGGGREQQNGVAS